MYSFSVFLNAGSGKPNNNNLGKLPSSYPFCALALDIQCNLFCLHFFSLKFRPKLLLLPPSFDHPLPSFALFLDIGIAQMRDIVVGSLNEEIRHVTFETGSPAGDLPKY